MISQRRLPYANNFEVLASTAVVLTCLLFFVLAAGRAFYSGTYLLVFLCFQVVWFGLEVWFRNRFITYRFAVLPTVVALSPGDFPEHHVAFSAIPDPARFKEMDAVVADFNAYFDGDWMACLAQCRNSGIPVIPLDVFLENVWGRIPPELSRSALLAYASMPRPYLIIKPLLERAAAALALTVILPLLALTAILVKATSPGPVFFRQRRVGLNNQPFTIYKFRTMRAGVDRLGSYAIIDNDERLTPIGGFLRKFHIDELPQLFNVLKGDMALVGPRPETTELAGHYARVIDGYDLRHAMRPGVVSWALIHQGNVSGVADTRIKLSYDLYYLKHASAFLDFYIILKTVWVMLIGVETLASPDGLKLFPKTGGR